jgi:UDP-2-acetamido-3-amino-2,3-dideoxy-glucuronate N-acetyltransferase
LEDLLNDESVEGVAVATPAESHRAVVQSCLQAGKHVYVEKPLAASSADAEALAVLSAEVGRVLMVGHLFLYEPAMTALIRLVKEGAIGEIRYLHSIRTSMSGTARLDTNIVWDAFVHDAYVLPAVLGRWPSRVQAAGRGYLDARLEDVAIVTLDWGGGVFASVYVSWYALEKARRLTVIGSKGIVVWDDLAPARLTLFDRSYAPGEERDNRGRLRWHWHDGGAKIVEVPKGEPLRAECEHFVDCAMGRKRPMTDARAGAETVRLIEACNRSLRLDGAWVSMDGRSYASGSQG